MVDIKMLKAQMTLNGYTIERLAKELGISTKTLSTRLNVSPEKFTQEQMQRIVDVLKIKNPMSIFFSHVLRDTKQDGHLN